MRKLTKLQVDALAKQVGTHRIEENLFLRVREGKRGARALWLFKYAFEGADRAESFGGYPEVTLAEASARAFEYRRNLAGGIDPIAKRESEKAKATLLAHTFKEAADDYFARRRSQLAPGTHRNWNYYLRNHVHPLIGDIPVNDIDVAHITQVLEPIWTKITAQIINWLMENIFDHASAKGWRDKQKANPAVRKNNLEHNAALPPTKSFHETPTTTACPGG